MNFYIASARRCAVNLSGNFLGIADGNLRRFTVEKDELPTFLELLPEENLLLPANIFLEKSKLKSLKSNLPKTLQSDKDEYLQNFYKNNDSDIKIFDFYEDILLLPTFSPRPQKGFKVIFFSEYEDISVSVILDGFYKIVIKNNYGSYSDCLPCNYCFNVDCELVGNILLVKIADKRQIVLLFNIGNSPEIMATINYEKIINYEDKIIITQQKRGITRHFFTYEYNLKSAEKIDEKFTRSKPISSLSALLIPFAFLEELSCGGDYSDFLSDDLKEHYKLVKKFFGDFSTFLPYNYERFSAVIVGKNAKKITFTIENNKITDFYYK